MIDLCECSSDFHENLNVYTKTMKTNSNPQLIKNHWLIVLYKGDHSAVKLGYFQRKLNIFLNHR